jgi:hypothetical protein
MATIATVFDYMRTFAGDLGSRIVESYPPLHAPGDPVSPRMKELLRKPLRAQELAIMGTVKYLQRANSAKIVAEMGSGKSLMSLAACHVHADGKPFTALYMVPPHLTKKTAREAFLTLPNIRVFLIEDMRNGGDIRKPHGINEVVLNRDGEIVRKGVNFSLSELRHMGRKGWRKFARGKNAIFVLSKEKGKLGYFWKEAFEVKNSGSKSNIGAVVNPDTGAPIELSSGGYLTRLNLVTNKKFSEIVKRKDGSQQFSPLWQADRKKIQRMAPLEFMGRYMKGWFDYSVADELHQLAGDTAQGNGLGTLGRIGRKLIGLTGTMMGGYANDLFNIFYRMDAPKVAKEGFSYGSEGRKLFQDTYGVCEQIIRHDLEEDNRSSKAKKSNVTIKRKPGCSPLLFGRFLMENTSFVSLEDISSDLPPYAESVIPVEMDADLKDAYDEVKDAIKDALKEYPKNPSLTSMMLQTLLCYPDHPFGFDMLKARVPDDHGGYHMVDICQPRDLDETKVYAKEKALIDDIKTELAEGRKVQVFATFTGDHDVTLRLKTILERAGLRVAVMKSTVPTESREAWYKERLREGVQVCICHPKLVETGLDLLDFPTIYFYETGYSLHTLRQASRRSWRIGQKKDVKVKFFFYSETAQEKCVKLMGRKMLVALMMEGKFSGEGLDGFEEDDDMMTAMVRELVEDGGVGESADEIWKNLNQERQSHLAQPSTEEVDQVLDQMEIDNGLDRVELPEGDRTPMQEMVEEVFNFAANASEGNSIVQNGLAAFASAKTSKKRAKAEAAGQMSMF